MRETTREYEYTQLKSVDLVIKQLGEVTMHVWILSKSARNLNAIRFALLDQYQDNESICLR